MSTVRTALIIGGGIAGPVAAMALQKAGIDATVYESYEGTADGVGGGLGLAPNGLNALGVIGADEPVRGIGTPVASMIMQSWTGKRLAELGSAQGPPIMHIMQRAELCQALREEAMRRGIRFEHGKRLITAQDNGSGVTASFSDGSRAAADILVGADGVRSTVRSLIDPNAPRPGYTGLLGFGGWADAAGMAATGGAMNMIFGKRAFFSYWVDTTGVGWFANLPCEQPMSLTEANAVGAEKWLSVLREVFAGDRTPALGILRRVTPANLLTVGALEILPAVPRWHRGRFVLIGDAAHAPSPSSGQGASQAIEGAVHLARCLRDLPVEKAFPAYERLRRARVERITAMAARNNKNKAAGPIARVLRDLTMPIAMKLLAKPEKMSWQVDYRIDWDAPVSSTGSHEVVSAQRTSGQR